MRETLTDLLKIEADVSLTNASRVKVLVTNAFALSIC